jgi:hypothetical protein
MAAADVKYTREQLVEAEKARNDTASAISDYRADVTEPAPPSVFEDLDALLTFLPTPPGVLPRSAAEAGRPKSCCRRLRTRSRASKQDTAAKVPVESHLPWAQGGPAGDVVRH